MKVVYLGLSHFQITVEATEENGDCFLHLYNGEYDEHNPAEEVPISKEFFKAIEKEFGNRFNNN